MAAGHPSNKGGLIRQPLVVVGGDAAGMSAASAARRLRGPDDLKIVAFERGNDRHAVVVGAGYIGLDLAEAFCAWDVAVTMISGGRPPMATLDPDMGGMLVEAMRRFGMTLRLGETVTGFESHAGRVRAVLTDRARSPPTW